MDLTEQQVRCIQEWAERAGVVETVRLYGSRAKGSARSDSDVNLALTVGTSHYVRFLNEWHKELSDALILKVMLKQYNSPADDTVRRYRATSSAWCCSRDKDKKGVDRSRHPTLAKSFCWLRAKVGPCRRIGARWLHPGLLLSHPDREAFWNTRSFRGLNRRPVACIRTTAASRVTGSAPS